MGYQLLSAGTPEDGGNGASATGGVETLSRMGLAEFSLTAGTMLLSYVTPAVSATVTKLMVGSGSTGASGLTLARIAIFRVAANGDLTKVAQTASQTGMGSSTFSVYEYALSTAGGFPASYTAAAGVRHAFGVLQVGTTAMKMQGLLVLDGAVAPIPAQTVAGQADIAAGYTAGQLTPTFTMGYVRGRP